MDVAETANIMGCSQGSVKTHCSRAVHAMAAELKMQGLDKLGLANLDSGKLSLNKTNLSH